MKRRAKGSENSRNSSKKHGSAEKKSKKNEKPKAGESLVENETLSSAEVEKMDVTQLLALGEGDGGSFNKSESVPDFSDSDTSDFEEVIEEKPETSRSSNISITVEIPGIPQKKKKKNDPEDVFQREINRIKKEIQILLHKVSLLGWLAYVRYMNLILNSEELLGVAMSVITSKNCYPPKRADIKYLEMIVSWFTKKICLNTNMLQENHVLLLQQLVKEFEVKTASSAKHVVYMFVVMLRMLGLQTRLVVSLQVLPIKPEFVVKDGNSMGVTSKTSTSKVRSSQVIKKEVPSVSTEEDKGETKSKYFKAVPKKPVRRAGLSKDISNEEVSPHFKQTGCKNVHSKKDSKREDKKKDENVVCLPLKKVKEKVDVWAEVFVEAEEKWISVDVIRGKIHCVQDIMSNATTPIVYAIACNNDLTLKDVTQRYVPRWHSITKKLRVDDHWWRQTIRPFSPPNNASNREEDEDLERQLTDQPLPATMSEYKGHPLYVLKRHLLKYEGIYPSDASPLGFFKQEPVYARECVHVLRSRENWYKEARVVKVKQEPYKIVKSRPKFDKMTGQHKTDLPLELFGLWQTEQYKPPTAVDGKVPRNEYGNVDLFKPCMLPIGTVHLKHSGLMKIAKKLEIDCANAMVGFDFHSGGCHAVYDGVVVCKELQELLIDAWNEEEEEATKKCEEKRTKRIYDNWKRLIRGLLIREKLKIKYSFGEASDDQQASTSTSKPTKKHR